MFAPLVLMDGMDARYGLDGFGSVGSHPSLTLGTLMATGFPRGSFAEEPYITVTFVPSGQLS